MSPTAILSILLLLLPLLLHPPSPTAAEAEVTPTVYEVLEEYNFPVGLLPLGITNYDIDRSTGKFNVYLDKECKFSIDGYDLRYKKTISGVISKDKLKDLKGISVKILLFWVNIVEVTRDDDEINFSVGIASAGFDLDSFYESPQCGCGFDCVNGQTRDEKKIDLKKRLVSSS